MSEPLLQTTVNKYLWHIGARRLFIRYRHNVDGTDTFPSITGAVIYQAPSSGIILFDQRVIPWHRVVTVIDTQDKPTLLWGKIINPEDKVWNPE